MCYYCSWFVIVILCLLVILFAIPARTHTQTDKLCDLQEAHFSQSRLILFLSPADDRLCTNSDDTGNADQRQIVYKLHLFYYEGKVLVIDRCHHRSRLEIILFVAGMYSQTGFISNQNCMGFACFLLHNSIAFFKCLEK